ncbi:DgyrCDS4164 [Dimorphilus gyrociliatus]|uniref:DgyrCDS4164 n=1 Tax=Dimorphilus gyrociliatus TaxID=2664684 RepID=A0A7I8VHM0_9ANNE|nr:DgyrCDS4164 [Dimorphilus gyrociliatus]
MEEEEVKRQDTSKDLATQLESQFIPEKTETGELTSKENDHHEISNKEEDEITCQYSEKDEAFFNTTMVTHTKVDNEATNLQETVEYEETITKSHTRLTNESVQHLISTFDEGTEAHVEQRTALLLNNNVSPNDENDENIAQSYQTHEQHLAIKLSESESEYNTDKGYVEERIVVKRTIIKSEIDGKETTEILDDTHEMTEIDNYTQRPSDTHEDPNNKLKNGEQMEIVEELNSREIDKVNDDLVSKNETSTSEEKETNTLLEANVSESEREKVQNHQNDEKITATDVEKSDNVSYTSSETSFTVSLGGSFNKRIKFQSGYRESVTNGINLYSIKMEPSVIPAKSVVFLCHDYGEHMGYMEEIGQRLTLEGHLVIGHDFVYHGRSEGLPRGMIGNFLNVVKDVLRHSNEAKRDFFNLKLFIIGQGIGGLVALHSVLRDPKLFSGLILLSPFLSKSSLMDNAAMVAFSKALSFFSPEARLFPRNDYSDLSRSADLVESYKEDVLNYHGKVHARTGIEILKAVEEATESMDDLKLPWLCLHGKSDKKAPLRGSKLLRDLSPSADKTLTEFTGAKHMLLKEIYPVKYSVFNQICVWLESRVYTA